MRKENENKGFTLVELIVVIVILAILAAILVPALLGYIDRAKGSQIVLNAKSCYTAAQAEASSAYAVAKGDQTLADLLDANSGARKKRIMDTADVPNCTKLYIAVEPDTNTLAHKNWTIKYVYYAEGTLGEYFDGTQWIDDTTGDEGQCGLPSTTSWIEVYKKPASTTTTP